MSSVLLLQAVKEKCRGKHAPHNIKLLPFDLCGAPDTLKQAASEAAQAFPGCSVQYLVHNAGVMLYVHLMEAFYSGLLSFLNKQDVWCMHAACQALAAVQTS